MKRTIKSSKGVAPKKRKRRVTRRSKIQKIIDSMECSKNFKCYESKFKELCKVKDIGLKSFVLCLDNEPQKCEFSLLLVDEYLCKCPLRVFIAKEVKK